MCGSQTGIYFDMRYVLKNKETGQFLSRAGEWTRFIAEAQRFPNGWSINLHLENVPLNYRERVQVVELSSK